MALAGWFAISLWVTAAAAPDSSVAPDSLRADSTRSVPAVVRRTFSDILVRAPRFDPRSAETRIRLDARSLRELPVDGLVDALRLQAGVVADGEILHVRGARPGELAIELEGLTLNDPIRGQPPEIPLAAIDEAELVTGGLEASHGGGLAGTLVLKTVEPTPRWGGRLLWQTDGRSSTHFDRVSGRVTGPLGLGGLGVVASGETRLDDTFMPAMRKPGRSDALGGSFGWRADSRVLAHAQISSLLNPGGFSLQALFSRRLDMPYDPMWALRGWTSPCPDDSCLYGPAFSEDTPDSTDGLRFEPYNAAEHSSMTDTRQWTVVAAATREVAGGRAHLALGWSENRRIVSPNGRDDESYLTLGNLPQWGFEEGRTSDPFHVYLGDELYYQRALSRKLEARADWERRWTAGHRLGGGLGVTRESFEFRELDWAIRRRFLDTLRTFSGSAPGAYAFVQGRWDREGFVLNAGLRAEWFTPGEAARLGPFGQAPKAQIAISPRVGLSYPLSLRDVFSVAYVRISQPPPRQFLYDDRDVINNRHPLGNPSLQAATAISYEASLRHVFDERWSARTGYFYRDLFRQVSARNFRFRFSPGGPFPSDYELRYASDDAGRATGIELAIWRAEDSNSLELSYTWMQTEGSESFEDGVPFYALLGAQPVPISEHPLAWDQRHRLSLSGWRRGRALAMSWSTTVGTGFPWTPATRRQLDADLSRVHSRRLTWSESTDASARLVVPWTRTHLEVGVDVRNVFDFRADRKASVSGYPNPLINSVYDDYAAFREQTGYGGGAYWEDANGDGQPGWVRVNDPRLATPPRTIRAVVSTSW